MPCNNLYGSSNAPESKETPVQHTRPFSDPPSAKRQRTDETGSYTESRLIPPDETHEGSPESVPRSEPRSQSTVSLYEDTSLKAELPEFRCVDGLVSGHHHGRRHRRHKDKSFGNKAPRVSYYTDIDDRDPIVDLSDESGSEKNRLGNGRPVPKPRASSGSAHPERLSFRGPADAEISRLNKPPPQRVGQQRQRPLVRGTKRPNPEELDELSEDTPYLIPRGNKRINIDPGGNGNRNGNSNDKPTSNAASNASHSLSVSRRGDIMPTNISRFTSTVGHLHLKGAVRIPSHVYSSSIGMPPNLQSNEPCYLKAVDGPPVGLFPFLENGTPYTDQHWLRVELPKLRAVQYSRDSRILKVSQSASADCGSLMFFEFFDSESVALVARWLRCRKIKIDLLEP